MVCGHGTAGCHGWVENNPTAAEAQGWHVRPWQNPADYPVYYRDGWRVLTEDGKVEYVSREGDCGGAMQASG